MSNGTPALTPGQEPQQQKNLQGVAFPVLDQSEQPPELKDLYQSVVSKGRDAMTWYARQKEGKKRWGQRLRMAAILLTALAGMTPMVVQILPNEAAYQRWSLLASVFAVMAATCVGLDNPVGASSGWMRYVSAYQEINSRLEALQAVLEQRVEAQRTALASAPSMIYGAIKVMTEGSEKHKDGRWKVVLGTGRELSGSGAQAVVATSLGPGLLGLRFEAVLKDGRLFVTEDVTTIKASEVTTHVFMVP